MPSVRKHQTVYILWWPLLYPKDARFIQHRQINKCNIKHSLRTEAIWLSWYRKFNILSWWIFRRNSNIRGIFQVNKGSIQQTYSQYYTNWRKIEACTQTWNETRVLILSTFIYGSVWSLSYGNNQEKEIRGIQILKGGSQISQFVAGMIHYIKDSIRKRSDKHFKKVEYKINI